MKETRQAGCRYWIVSFGLYDAHIVEADGEDAIATNPIRTYRVNHRYLRHSYGNIDEKIQAKFENQRMIIDPRIMVDHSADVDSLLAELKLNGSSIDRESLEARVDLARLLAGIYPEGFDEQVQRYERIQSMPDSKLYEEIRADLKRKSEYVPPQIHNLTRNELELGLPQAGYITGKQGYESMAKALDALYNAWENIMADPEKMKAVESPETYEGTDSFGGLFR